MINEDITSELYQSVKIYKLVDLLIDMLQTYSYGCGNLKFEILKQDIIEHIETGNLFSSNFTDDAKKIAGNWIITYKENNKEENK